MKKKFSVKELTDSGLALALIITIIGFITDNPVWFAVLLPVLVLAMTFGKVFYPFAFIWYNLSELLGTVVSKVILTLVYIFVLLPVALIKRVGGYDPMNIREFKKSNTSVFINRNHKYKKEDLDKTY